MTDNRMVAIIFQECMAERELSFRMLTVDDKTVFIPKSQIEDFETGDHRAGDKNLTLVIPEWLAIEEGLV